MLTEVCLLNGVNVVGHEEHPQYLLFSILQKTGHPFGGFDTGNVFGVADMENGFVGMVNVFGFVGMVNIFGVVGTVNVFGGSDYWY